MDLNKIKTIQEDLEKEAGHKLPDWAGKDVYEYLSSELKWRLIGDEPAYLIGLSEDRWDYYWVYINNKESKLHFMTCLYDVSKVCERVTKKWSMDEKKNINKVVQNHFNEHKDEKLLFYIWDTTICNLNE